MQLCTKSFITFVLTIVHPCSVDADVITNNQANNVTDNIFQKIGVNLHQDAWLAIALMSAAANTDREALSWQ